MKILRTSKATLFSLQAFSDYVGKFHRHRRKLWPFLGLWKLAVVVILVYFLGSSLLISSALVGPNETQSNSKGKFSFINEFCNEDLP